MNKYIVVFITAKDKKQAQAIANGLLKAKLIACANIVNQIESLFCWQGKLDKASEALLIIKTQRKLFKKIMAKVKLLHTYEIPEIIALPIMDGSRDYLKWIDETCQGS